MTLKVGDFVKHHEEWYKYNAISKDDCGNAKVLEIGDGYIVLQETYYGTLILYPGKKKRLDSLKMEVVIVPLKEYEALQSTQAHMNKLEELGVDNWEHYVGPDDELELDE